jgi:hypothetical protein
MMPPGLLQNIILCISRHFPRTLARLLDTAVESRVWTEHALSCQKPDTCCSRSLAVYSSSVEQNLGDEKLSAKFKRVFLRAIWIR